MTNKYVFLILIFIALDSRADGIPCPQPSNEIVENAKPFKLITLSLLNSPDTIFNNLNEAIESHVNEKTPIRYVDTGFKGLPKFPTYSQCKQTFFRVAVINKAIDKIIIEDGWKSGWVRRKDELEKSGSAVNNREFDALPPESSLEERVIEYVRVKNVPSKFPKHSSVVGVLANPIRSMSVGYHTGYDNGMRGYHMRLDEIELGPCAKELECRKLSAIDSTEVFNKRNLTPRYSTEGEWAVDSHIPAKCITATYRTKFHKIDDVYYSDANGNTGGGK